MTNTFFLAADALPMEEPINPLIPPLYDIVWSIIPFAVILFIFAKVVLPKFQEVLTQREDKIEGGIQRAEAAKAEAQEALDKYNKQLAEARTEAAQIRDDARSQGQKIIADMKAQASEESNRIVEAGNKQLEANRASVVADLRKEMGENSINLAERLLGEQLTDDVKRSGTIDNFLAGLDNVGTAGK